MSDEVLEQMLATMEDVPLLYAPSPFWKKLVRQHIAELNQNGFENFKRAVNMRYFAWGILDIIRHQLLPMLRSWAKRPRSTPFTARFERYQVARGSKVKSFNAASATLYKIYVAMLADFVESMDTYGLIDKVSEPAVGNPFLIEYKGRRLSQDLCNSIHEFTVL